MSSSATQAATMLPKFVEEDSDLPEPLNTAAKQEKRAKTLAAAHTGKKAHRVESPGVQGYFSRTRIVKLVGGDKIVIQFRIQPLEIECFDTARRLFGNVIPEIIELHDEELQAFGMRVYAMTYMPGQCWVRVPSSKMEARIQIARSLGAILGRGSMGGQSADVVDDYILPCLTDFLKRLDDTTKFLRPHVERLIAASAGLKKLPLYFSHHDLNEMNVLVGEDYAVTGIVDWECARALQFGMGLHRITDTIVAENSLGCIEIPDGSETAETAFWDAVLDKAPKAVLENLEDVQNALHTGALMFAITEGHLTGSIKFLAGVLTYGMPQLRGDNNPFAKEHMPT
jgi:hypothetical protein